MRKSLVFIGFMLFQSHHLQSQELPGLNFCLLFDSSFEKDAFTNRNENQCDPLVYLLANEPKTDAPMYYRIKKELSDFAGKLNTKRKRYKSEEQFLSHVFYKIHNRYLKDYQYPGSFNAIFNNGSYHCLSGAALYACLLSQLGYDPNIYETRYHVFLLISLKNSKRILLETTDPTHGFINTESGITSHIRNYMAEEEKKLLTKTSISAPFNMKPVLKKITLRELAALHYYNQGVDLVNRENYFDGYRALNKAKLLYPESQKINHLMLFTSEKYNVEMETSSHRQ